MRPGRGSCSPDHGTAAPVTPWTAPVETPEGRDGHYTRRGSTQTRRTGCRPARAAAGCRGDDAWPDSGPARRRSGPAGDNPASTVGMIALLSVSMLVMAIAMFNRRPGPPRPAPQEFPGARVVSGPLAPASGPDRTRAADRMATRRHRPQPPRPGIPIRATDRAPDMPDSADIPPSATAPTGSPAKPATPTAC